MSTLTLSTPTAGLRSAGGRSTRRPAGRSTPLSSAPLRLTRRGRVLVAAVLVIAVLGAMALLGGRSAATPAAGTARPTRSVVVSEGDTLWEIAADVAGPGEIRGMVHAIQKLNSLPSTQLVEGQRLAVPIP